MFDDGFVASPNPLHEYGMTSGNASSDPQDSIESTPGEFQDDSPATTTDDDVLCKSDGLDREARSRSDVGRDGPSRDCRSAFVERGFLACGGISPMGSASAILFSEVENPAPSGDGVAIDIRMTPSP